MGYEVGGDDGELNLTLEIISALGFTRAVRVYMQLAELTIVCLLLLHVLATSTVISGRVPTCDSTYS